MSKWVRVEGDSCPKCGAPIEVLVDKDNKFDTDKGLNFRWRKDVQNAVGSMSWQKGF